MPPILTSLPEAKDDGGMPLTSHKAIDSEVVLREVVDRKCRLQSLVNAVSIDTLTKVCSI